MCLLRTHVFPLHDVFSGEPMSPHGPRASLLMGTAPFPPWHSKALYQSALADQQTDLLSPTL